MKRHDLFENFTKYLFDNWNSSEKEKFTVKESRNKDNMLNYELYIEIHNEQELEEATEAVIHFLDYAHTWNEEKKLVNSPYNTRFQTAEEIRENVKEQYRQNP